MLDQMFNTPLTFPLNRVEDEFLILEGREGVICEAESAPTNRRRPTQTSTGTMITFISLPRMERSSIAEELLALMIIQRMLMKLQGLATGDGDEDEVQVYGLRAEHLRSAEK